MNESGKRRVLVTIRDAIETMTDLIERQDRENKALRVIISLCAEALANGALISPAASVEFMEKLPGEIRLHVNKLRREAAKTAKPRLRARLTH